MNKKEEEEIKKTFFYKHNALSLACIKLKEEVIKLYTPLFFIICAFIGGFREVRRIEREYNRELRYYRKTNSYELSKIMYIALHSPLTLYEASEVYPLAQRCQVDKYQVAEFACVAEGNAEATKRMLVQQAEEECGNLCT